MFGLARRRVVIALACRAVVASLEVGQFVLFAPNTNWKPAMTHQIARVGLMTLVALCGLSCSVPEALCPQAPEEGMAAKDDAGLPNFDIRFDASGQPTQHVRDLHWSGMRSPRRLPPNLPSFAPAPRT